MSIHEIKNKSRMSVGSAETNDGLECKLTTSELRKRKETIIESLKNKLLGKQDLHNGYAYRFPGTDDIIDELTQFVKTERTCCGFFDFHLIIGGEGKDILLQITGPQGVKDFISTELEI